MCMGGGHVQGPNTSVPASRGVASLPYNMKPSSRCLSLPAFRLAPVSSSVAQEVIQRVGFLEARACVKGTQLVTNAWTVPN